MLSKQLAEAAIFPAVDIEASISRAMMQVVTQEHLQAARRFKQVYTTFAQNRDLVNVGAYSRGTNPELDMAVDAYPDLVRFLTQDVNESVPLADSINQLQLLQARFQPEPPQPAAGVPGVPQV